MGWLFRDSSFFMLKKFFSLTGLIVIAAFSRLLPHPWNWTAISAAALLGGSRFDKVWEAIFVPLAAMVLTDFIFGSHATMGYVYGAIALTSLISFVFRSRIKGLNIGLGSFLASAVFFLITNFGIWMSGGLYPADVGGLAACYIAGFPFLVSQTLGDLFYAALLFLIWDKGAHRLLMTAVGQKSIARMSFRAVKT